MLRPGRKTRLPERRLGNMSLLVCPTFPSGVLLSYSEPPRVQKFKGQQHPKEIGRHSNESSSLFLSQTCVSVLDLGAGKTQSPPPPSHPHSQLRASTRSLAYRHGTDWTTHGKPEVISIFISIIFSFGRPLRISSLRIRMRLSGGASKAAVRGCCSPIKALANEARAGFGCGQKPARGQRRAAGAGRLWRTADKAGRSDRWAVLLLRLHCRRPSAPLFWGKWRGLITTHSCVAFLASSMTPH